MTDVISHRGPDGEGQWQNSKRTVSLGHRRLSILDLSEAGAQPMFYADGQLVIVFNGEIYNYVELRKQMLDKGYAFKSDSDTEVLMAMYAAYGEACLQYMDGMFAFAIWDEKKQLLFCARDRFGEKPFYFCKADGDFIFGSEIKCLVAAGISKRLNYRMVNRYFNDKYYLININRLSETFYEDIERLEPAHYLIIKADGSLIKRQYWKLDHDQVNEGISFDEAVEQFRELFFTSVARRLRSDVPVGSSLSGGLDSSSIVCAINHLNRDTNAEQYTFSARFPGWKKDESRHIDAVLAHTGINGFSTYPDPAGFLDEFERFMQHQEEPVPAANQYAQWEVMKLARQHGVTVLLDGQGADETITGYDHYFKHYFKEQYRKQPVLVDEEIAAYNNLHERSFSVTELLENSMTMQAPAKAGWKDKLLRAHPVKKAWYGLRASRNFFSADFLATVWPEQEQVYNQEPSTLGQSLWNDTFLGGLESLLRYGDRNSMAFGREVRLPFLNHELVEFLFTLPGSFKIHKGWSKYLLRKSMEPFLPAEITWRKDKIGYEPPQHQWLENPKIEALVNHSRERLVKEGILNSKAPLPEASRHWQMMVVASMLP